MEDSTTIGGMFKHMAECLAALFRRKSFLHSHIGGDMGEMEFIEADNNVKDFVSLGQQYQDATVELIIRISSIHCYEQWFPRADCLCFTFRDGRDGGYVAHSLEHFG